MEKNINVVFICDSNYLIPTRTAINSMIQNKKEGVFLHIIIVGIGMEQKEICNFQMFQSSEVKVNLLIPDSYFDDIKICHVYVSKAALYKMLLPELLPDIDKVIYLDSDILILKDIQKLYDIEVEDRYAAVVRDMYVEKTSKRNETKKVEYYFNSGVMLLNLAELRKKGIVRKLVEDRKSDGCMLYMDQDTFNVVFNRHIKVISPTFNYLNIYSTFSAKQMADYYGIKESEVMQIRNLPVILHLASGEKPWNGIYENNTLWYQYVLPHDYLNVIKRILKPFENGINYKDYVIRQHIQQYEQTILFYKNNCQFKVNIETLAGVEKDVFIMQDVIKKIVNDGIRDKKLRTYGLEIFGAGRMAQALYKLLWKEGYGNYIKGFVVQQKEANIAEMYGKQVVSLAECDGTKEWIFVAVKSVEREIVDELLRRGYTKVIELSDIIYKNDINL